MAGNRQERIEDVLEIVTGPLPGENLLRSFREALLTENVFRIMFGDQGQRIFENSRPNLNETILPALILSWRSESTQSNDVYLDGQIDMLLVLPTRLRGDYNGQRRVANMLQRWMGGAMNLFAENPGLIKFGYGTEWAYNDLVQQGGFEAPLITATIPYRFDLQYMQRMVEGFDPNRPLDSSDVGYLEQIGIGLTNSDDGSTLLEVQIATGEENPGLGQD